MENNVQLKIEDAAINQSLLLLVPSEIIYGPGEPVLDALALKDAVDWTIEQSIRKAGAA